MRILYLNHSSRISGAEISLLTHLDHLAAAPVQAVAACPPGELLEAFQTRHVPTVTLPDFEVSFSRSMPRLARMAAQLPVRAAQWAHALRALQVDLVHANSVRAGLVAGLGQPWHRVPVLTHVRDVLPPTPVSRWIQQGVYGVSSHVIANSHFTAQRFAPVPGAAAKMTVVYNAADLTRFDPDRISGHPVRTEFNLSGAYPLLAVVGQITPWKGQVDAIHALAAVRTQFPAARLLIVGGNRFGYGTARYDNAAYAAELEATAARLGVAEAVTFTGHRTDIPAVLAAVDLLLMPSWEEPFGRSVIEAMAMGKPVVATAVGGPAEIIEAGVTGELVEPRDPAALAAAIQRLVRNPGRLRSMGRQARQAVLARFTPERMVAETVAVYHQMLHSAAPVSQPVRSSVSAEGWS